MQFGTNDSMEAGSLVELFPDWDGEMIPLYAIYPTRRHRAAKVRAFVDFVVDTIAKNRRARENPKIDAKSLKNIVFDAPA